MEMVELDFFFSVAKSRKHLYPCYFGSPFMMVVTATLQLDDERDTWENCRHFMSTCRQAKRAMNWILLLAMADYMTQGWS